MIWSEMSYARYAQGSAETEPETWEDAFNVYGELMED